MRASKTTSGGDPDTPRGPGAPQADGLGRFVPRVFLTDILACPCGGRLRLFAVITQPDVIQAVAAAIILSHRYSFWLAVADAIAADIV